MKAIFPDWRARGVTAVLHEHKGGFAHNLDSVAGMQAKAESTGAQLITGVEVTGFELASDGSVRAAVTNQGRIECDELIVAPGPWAKHLWAMLELPPTIDVHQPNGDVARDQPMWTYWNLQEGEISVDPKLFSLEDGSMPPVVHLDTDAPLYTDDGKLVTDELWGIYYKQDRHGIQGGASPLTVGPEAPIDPYPSTTDVDPEFPDMWCAALSHAMSRFEGKRPLYKQARSGGMGAFTVDNFPVFDYVRPNVYGIFDSNHGYKMLGVGPRGREGDRGRRLAPAATLPPGALRDRRSAPGLELALPLVVARRRRPAVAASRAAARDSGCAAARRASASKRSGPCSPSTATSRPSSASTGAAIAFRPGSRSPAASATPAARTSATASSSSASVVSVRGV